MSKNAVDASIFTCIYPTVCALFWVSHAYNRKRIFLIPETKHWLEIESLVVSREKIKVTLGELLVSFGRPDRYKPGLTLDA